MRASLLSAVLICCFVMGNAGPPPSDVALAQLTLGIPASPLPAGTTQAIFGFSLANSHGSSITFSAVNFALSNDPSGLLTNFKLYASTDNTFDVGDASIATASGVTVTQVKFTALGQTIGNGVTKNYFLVADVSSSVNSGTATTIQVTMADTDVTLGVGTLNTTSFSGTTYSFKATVSLAQLTGGVATVLAANATAQAVLGFSLTSTSSFGQFNTLNVSTSSTPTAKLTNFKLYSSTDGTYDGTDVAIAGLTITPGSPTTTITGLTDALSSSGKNYFLVADVAAGVTTGTSEQFSITNTNVGTTETVVNNITGTNYGFTFGVTFASLSTPGTVLNSGTSDLAIFGFSAVSTGASTFTGINIQLSLDPASKLSNFRLCLSSNAVYDGIGTDVPISGLTITNSTSQVQITGLTENISSIKRYFLVADVSSSVNSSSGTETASFSNGNVTITAGATNSTFTLTGTAYTFLDIIPPTLSSFTPVDGSTGIPTTTTLVMNFDRNVDVSTTASANINVTITGGSSPIVIPRSDAQIAIAGSVITITLTTPLELNTNYTVTIGAHAFANADKTTADYAGISSGTTWNFKTDTGITPNNPTQGVCQNKFTTVPPMVLLESSNDNFHGVASATRTIILGFDAPGFSFKSGTTGVSPTRTGGNDIASISVTSVTFSSATISVTFTSGNVNNDQDQITISGLQVEYDGTSATPVHIVQTGGTLSVDYASPNLATLNGASQSATPGSSGSNKLTYCLNQVLTGANTVSLTGVGPTFNWYSDPTASTVPLATVSTTTVSSLGVNTSSVNTTPVYATMTEAGKCESIPLAVVFNVSPLPVADAGPDYIGVNSICFKTTKSIGGTPTLKVPSVTGPYTFAWTDNSSPVTTYDPTYSASTPNPIITPGDPGASPQTWTYTVTITDVNGCKGTDNMQVRVLDLSQPLSFTPADQASFLSTSPAVDLIPTINGGTFAGTGVSTITKPTAKSVFDPSKVDPGGSSVSVPVSYTATLTNGCKNTVTNNFTVSLGSSFFETSSSLQPLAAKYCNNESPFAIRLSSASLTQIMQFIYLWNTLYAPNYGYAPMSGPGNLLSPTAVLSFRNYYEYGVYSYGTNAPTAVRPSGSLYNQTYTDPATSTTQTLFNIQEMIFDPTAIKTDAAYPSCPTCNYAYIAVFIRFATSGVPIPPWNYSPPYDYSYLYDNGGGAFYQYSGDFVTVNPVPNASFTGLTSIVPAFPNDFCSGSNAIVLTGNQPNSNPGFFEVSSDGFGTSFPASTPGKFGVLDGLLGTATFDPTSAYSTLGGGTGPQLWVRYKVDPGTTGSTNQGCIGTSGIQNVTIHPIPNLVFSTPADNQQYCFDHIPVDLLATTTTASATITFTGLGGAGVVNLGPGVPANSFIGKFTPSQLLQSWEATLNSGNPASYGSRPALFNYVDAVVTDIYGCTKTIHKPMTINPLPPGALNAQINGGASVSAPATVNLCYNAGVATTLTEVFSKSGGAGSYFTIDYISAPDLFHETTCGSNTFVNCTTNGISFNPKTYYDNAVNTHLASSIATLGFQVNYTTYDPDHCLNNLAPILINVAPQIPVVISAGSVHSNDNICSNAGIPTINLNPFGGNLTVSFNGTPLGQQPTVTPDPGNSSVGQFSITPPVGGGNYQVHYDFITGTGCSNPQDFFVNTLPSPVSIFTPVPNCIGVPIQYQATPATNNVNAVYTWTIAGATFPGQNVVYPGFPNAGSFGVSLQVDYPINAGQICSSLSGGVGNQLISEYPKIDFDISQVCQGTDITQFTLTNSNNTNAPVAEAWWDLSDNSTTYPASSPNTYGATSLGVTGGQGTIGGTYGNPNHAYSAAGNFQVTVSARTSQANGYCADTKTRTISILQSLHPTIANPYFMSQLNGGDGFWVPEDRNGNGTWEFNAISNKVDANFNSASPAWVTNASGFYKSSDKSFVNSPCFDLSNFTKPAFSINYIYNTDPSKDGAVVQYSLDGGTNWTRLGNPNSGLDWYNSFGISSAPGGFGNVEGWSGGGKNQDWAAGKNSLSAILGQSKVRFRVAFASDAQDTLDGFAFNDVQIIERNRISLVENFSNLDPSIASAVAANESNFNALPPSEAVKLEFHTSFPGDDAVNKLDPEDHNGRSAFYGLTNVGGAIPQGFIDGITVGNFTPATANALSLRSLVNSPVTLAVTQMATAKPNILQLKVDVTALQDLTKGQPFLYVGIIEKQVGTMVNVVRRLLPSASGSVIPLPLLQGNVASITVGPWEIKNITDVNQLAVVAFVQDQVSQEVLQSLYQPTGITWPTQNLITEVLPVTADGITIYPNPADGEFTIQLPSPAQQNTKLTMANQLGQFTEVGALGEGEQSKRISTQGLAEGVYILQLGGNGSALRTKVVVLHK